MDMNAKMQRITEIIDNNNVVDIEISTEPKMNKTGNPYIGRVKKHTAYLGVEFGKNYADVVRERLLEEGKPTDFKAKKSPYTYVNKYFDRIGDQLYLRYILAKDAKPCKRIYEVDDRPATEQEAEEIESFMPSNKNSGANQGLSKENIVKPRWVKIQNVVALGGETWATEV